MNVPLKGLLCRRGRTGAKERLPALLANVSGGGAYMQMAEMFEPGERVLVLFSLSRSGLTGPRVAARARVLRAEEQVGGAYGMAVRFTSHRFL